MTGSAFVQAYAQGRPYSLHGAAAAQGFARLGYHVEWFRPPDLLERPMSDIAVVVGGTGTVREALRRGTGRVPEALHPPPELQPFLGRSAGTSTLGALAEQAIYPVFVKPYTTPKAFAAQVLHAPHELGVIRMPRPGFPPLPDAFEVSVQEVVRFVSEWRVFVMHGRAIGTSHYAGDPLRFPDARVVEEALAAYHAPPAGFAADFGVASDGRTLLVELNDGYALGHGGLLPTDYARLLKARWDELSTLGP